MVPGPGSGLGWGAARWALGLAVAVAGVVAAPQVVWAEPVPDIAPNTFAFSGAVSGVLHILPRYDCDGAGPAGVTLTVAGQLQNSKASSWVIQVLSLNNGVHSLRPGSVIGVTVSDSGGDLQWGLDSRGTLTVAGTTGTVDAQLSGTAGTSLHVTGAWSCRAG